MDSFLRLSVCIPAYSMGGMGAQYLKTSLDILGQQEFRDFEVVVADQSDDNSIAELCLSYENMSVRHLDTRHLKRQGSANTNAAIEAAQGEIIKVLFQDDFLNGNDALTKIAGAFDDPEVHWIVTGSEHTRDGQTLIRPFVPHFHSRIQFGKNTISSPSVLALRRAHAPKFDEVLIWLMDVDYYKQCSLCFGLPKVLLEPLVVNRQHSGQVSASVSRALVRRELRYVRQKYAAHMSWGDWWHYIGRLRRTFL
ncbi:glycosyltransferase family 2 protein [Parasedimentitalea maritima]|uniref:Glycosyltransferase family 2 protein n=1 Tax=Parasedimentitalea maritima TaxID=2578117 RepID=A0ABY2UZW8_9RHOB|nr:glycosyltransferase family 2 protein [Zongyanglinia marina]TLP65758.1 glycosyltransferase family 2 protein [Zongyanglinia marina]